MKRLVLLCVAVLALLAPSAAFADSVVLKVERGSHQVAVTRTGHRVALVHTRAAGRLRVGERVTFRSHTLTNGTLAASTVKVVGRTGKVAFTGLLLARTRTRYVISAGGAVVSVQRKSRRLASAGDNGPAPGSTVDVSATVGQNGELEDDDVHTVAPTTPGGRIEGVLTLGTGSITVTSEHMSLVLIVPSGLDLSSFQNNQEVLAEFSQQTNGSLVLTKLSGNDDAQEADSQGASAGTGNGSSDGQSSTGSGSGQNTGSGDTSSTGSDDGAGDDSNGGSGNDSGGDDSGGD
jgi:hypothetical protein